MDMTPKKTVYIADDNAAFAEFCAEVAVAEGWEARICSNGLKLVEALKESDAAALAIIDINMPEMDGIMVIDELQNAARKLRIRFVTGGPDSSALAARMIADARGLSTGSFLTKPLSLSNLQSVLREEADLHLS